MIWIIILSYFNDLNLAFIFILILCIYLNKNTYIIIVYILYNL